MIQRTRYEVALVALFGLAIGLMSFEQLGISYLMPFVQPALGLNNTQVGLLMSAYWVAFAVSSYTTGTLVDRIGRRKPLLVATLSAFATCSVLSACATSFAALFAARAFMGLWEGALFTAVQSFVALASAPERRGSNLGLVAGVCPNILGILVAPIVLVQLTLHFGWRIGFATVLVPGLITALLIATFIHEPVTTRSVANIGHGARHGRLTGILHLRNLWLCAGLCCFYVAYLNAGFTFLPLYYINIRHFSSQEMSLLMGVLGISAVLFAFILPAASDRLGRKPAMIASSLLSTVSPLAALYVSGPIGLLAPLMMIGWALSGTVSLIVSIIPSETVPPNGLSTAIGLIIAVGVIVGGLAGPGAAGWVADHWGLRAALLLQVGYAVGALLSSLALIETRPKPCAPT